MSSTINRGLLLVIPKQPYYDWANSLAEGLELYPSKEKEYSSYLIVDDWDRVDQDMLLAPHFAEIFEKELIGLTDFEEQWPRDRSYHNFCAYFDIKFSSVVVDLISKQPLTRDVALDVDDFDGGEYIKEVLGDLRKD
jgi:hypothetical protein